MTLYINFASFQAKQWNLTFPGVDNLHKFIVAKLHGTNTYIALLLNFKTSDRRADYQQASWLSLATKFS